MKWYFAKIVPLFLGALVSSLQAKEIADGLWNGKPWRLEDLDEGVSSGDVAALAEWAYWSHLGWQGTKIDKKLIFERAQTASAAGSLLGKAMLARCFSLGEGVEEDKVLAFQLAKDAAIKGHPFALNLMAIETLYRSDGVRYPYSRGLELWQESAKAGCVVAMGNLADTYYYGRYDTTKDRKKALKEGIRLLLEFDSAKGAELIFSHHRNRSKDPLFTPEVLKKAFRRNQEFAAAGYARAQAAVGRYYILTGYPNIGVPMMVRAARAQNLSSAGMLLDLATGNWLGRKAGAAGQYSTIFRLARKAYELGHSSQQVLRYTADSYIFSWGDRRDYAKAIPLVKKMQERGVDDANVSLANIYGDEKDNPFFSPDKAVNYLIYAGKESDVALHHLARFYLAGPESHRDLVKGIAITTAGAKHSWRKTVKSKHERLLKKHQGNLTEKQREEVKKLLAEEYPLGKRWRKQALRKLQQMGEEPVILSN